MSFRQYEVKRWAFEDDKTSGKYKDLFFGIQKRHEKIKGKANTIESCVVHLRDEFDKDYPLYHEVCFYYPVELKNKKYEKLDNGFEISSSFNQLINDSILEELVRKNLNHASIKLFSKEWESIDIEYSGFYLEDTVRKYKEQDQPFSVVYSRYSYLKDNNQCVDNGIVFIDERYRTTVMIHNEPFYGRSESDKSLYGDSYKKRTRAKWWLKKYYFIKIVNTKTNDEKKMSYIVESVFSGNNSNLIKP